MKTLFVLILLITTSASASQSTDSASDAFRAQMSAWNRQDLTAALSFYWDSEKITWVNRKGVTRGFREFADAMRADFKDPSKMGTYEGKVLHAEEVSRDAVLLVVEWKITSAEGKRMMGGVSTQLWRKMKSGWKITLEHAS